MKKKEYPLKEIIEIKKRRLEEAEKILRQKQDALVEAEKNLTEKKKLLNASEKVKLEMIEKHYKKIENGTTADVMERHNHYIQEVINVKIAEEKKKVEAQKKVVQEAHVALDKARAERLEKHKDLEKIHTHEKEWSKEAKKELEIFEAIVEDEIGTIIHGKQSRKKQ